MMLQRFFAASLIGISTITSALPQTEAASPTTSAASPQQTAAFLSALQSYYSSFLSSPAATSLGLNLAINLPASELASITSNIQAQLPIPTANFDLNAFATNPPLTFTTPAWLASASDIESGVQALETSVVLDAARIAQSVISTSVALRTPSVTGSGNAAGARETGVGTAMGAAAVAIGAAAVLL